MSEKSDTAVTVGHVVGSLQLRFATTRDPHRRFSARGEAAKGVPGLETELEILNQGVESWNEWRAANPGIRPSLVEADLIDRDLTGANFSETDLSGADLDGASLTSANLKMSSLHKADLAGADLSNADLYKADMTGVFGVGANLARAYLAEACLVGADLRGANLKGANLTQADVAGANLVGVDLAEADMSGADIRGADISQANIAGAGLHGLRYGSFMSMRGHYFALRGLDSCYGNALFTRDAQDQDYLDSLRRSIDETPSPVLRKAKQLAFRAWSIINFGRSLGKPAAYALTIALTFGALFSFDRSFEWGVMDYSRSADTVLTPFYYSIVTYTTLGYGDITPQNWVGEVLVVAEVIMGYTTLGLLLSILANRIARQS